MKKRDYGVRVVKGFEVKKVSQERIEVDFYLVYSKAENICPTTITVAWSFESDGDVDDEGVGFDCSRWSPEFEKCSAENLQSFFQTPYAKLDFADFSPQYIGWCNEGGVDTDAALVEIKAILEDIR